MSALPRPPPRERPKAERTRTAILKAAEAVFAEKGYAAARLEDVAQHVGIRRASMVYYFRDKRAVYEAVLASVFGDLLDRYRTLLRAPTTLPERILAALSAWIAYVGERPTVARLLLWEVAATPRSPAAARHAAPLVAAVRETIEEGQRAGLFSPIDPIHFIFTVVGATIFFVTATPALVSEWHFDPLSREQLEVHRDEVLSIARRLLGIDAPRTRQA